MKSFERDLCRLSRAALLLGCLCVTAIDVGGATFVVSNPNDQGPGSLRQAVMDSNAQAGSNTIVFSRTGPTWILLWAGEILVTNNVNIVGPGDELVVWGAQQNSRIFHTVNAAVTISSMSIAHGSNFLGGGVLQEGGSLTLSNCFIGSNVATFGGAIAQNNGTLRMTDCTVSSNRVGGTGMGIYIQGGSATTTLRRCTMVGNNGFGSSSSGGGISHYGTSLILDTCTLCGNGSSVGNGGGVLNGSGNAMITNCTFYGNHSLLGGGVAWQGGTITIRNSILAGNTSVTGSGAAPDCYGNIISGGFNLIGNRAGSGGWISSDQTGTTASPINPVLGPLQDNGGPNWTVEPLIGSPAIDKGHCSGAATDQRGRPRTYDKQGIPNAAGGDGSDIGAFETGTRTNLVTNHNDLGPGSLRQAILDAGDDVTTINFYPGLSGTIYLMTELWLDKDFIINGPGASILSLTGSGYRVLTVAAGATVISGLTFRDCTLSGREGTPFDDGGEVFGGAIANYLDLSLIDCVISNNFIEGGPGANVGGSAPSTNGGRARGGGIANFMHLSLTRCILAGNSARGGPGGEPVEDGEPGYGGDAFGGSLYNEGDVWLTNCAIYSSTAVGGSSSSGNWGSGAGGGIYNYVNILSLFNCTVASNTVPAGTGGGTYDGGYTGIYRNTTIAANHASVGGGLYASGSDIGNTLVAGNTAGSGVDVKGIFVSSDYNLIQHANGWVNIGPITYTILSQEPMLGPLQNNGGPIPTMALLPGSPAIDHGTNFGISTDQRGRLRPFDFLEVPNAIGGNGTDIGAFELSSPLLHIARSGTNAVISWSTNDPAFQLQATANLGLSAFWSNVTVTPMLSSNQFIVTDPLQTRRFYRLRSS